MTTSYITPVNQLSTVVRLSFRPLEHMCKATVQSHKFWRNSWWLGFYCYYYYLFVCFYSSYLFFFFVNIIYYVLFLLYIIYLLLFIFSIWDGVGTKDRFFHREWGMGGEALIRKNTGFLRGAGHYNLCWPE